MAVQALLRVEWPAELLHHAPLHGASDDPSAEVYMLHRWVVAGGSGK